MRPLRWRNNIITWLRNLVSHNRILTSTLIGFTLFLAARPTLRSICIGLPVVLAGEAIRTWSSGHIEKNDCLTISGPYLFTRNPLYFGNFILGLGFVIMSGVLLLFFIFIPLFFFIYDATITQEERFLADRYGDSFKAYQKKVPRFFPKVYRPAFSSGFFDWSLVKKHREQNTWIAILGGILLFVFKMLLYNYLP
ncbi:MAG: isoprenylcysteine carboxylmethyltransferase family protein [Nitrospirae bacterium]|nr:isoprenylcysteine carboxylmethyltransferase family protein [Nitrospirota bacterium]